MNKISDLSLGFVIGTALFACAPSGSDHSVQSKAPSALPTVVQAPPASGRFSTEEGPSYEVGIASAEADRVHALEQCSSKSKQERAACASAADAAYEEARSAAQQGRATTLQKPGAVISTAPGVSH